MNTRIFDLVLVCATLVGCGCFAGYFFGWSRGFDEGHALGDRRGRLLGALDFAAKRRGE